jgi:hypothetical protein
MAGFACPPQAELLFSRDFPDEVLDRGGQTAGYTMRVF